MPRRKRSEGKQFWPGAKQVFRRYVADGRLDHDFLALAGEAIYGEPLLRRVMQCGRAMPLPKLDDSRAAARENIARLPELLRDLDSCPPYGVEISQGLIDLSRQLTEQGR